MKLQLIHNTTPAKEEKHKVYHHEPISLSLVRLYNPNYARVHGYSPIPPTNLTKTGLVVYSHLYTVDVRIPDVRFGRHV